MPGPLFHLKYDVLVPLQETWQIMKVTYRFPALEPLIKSYRALYPYSGSAATISVDERQAKGIEDETLTYGETRWGTFLEILDALGIKSGQRFIDLGCGAGFLCLLASQGYGAKATGVDLIEGFIANGNKLIAMHQLADVEFKSADFFSIDFMPYDLFYATCTCFPAEVRKRLAEKFRHVRTGTKIATVTYPLEASWLKQVKTLKCTYSWGPDTVYICERI